MIPWLASGKANKYVVEDPSDIGNGQGVEECSISIVPRGSVFIGLVGQGKTRV